jgi:hypothetical protein
MKREDLVALGIEGEALEKVMALHGQDIEKQKSALVAAQTELGTTQGQLTEANKAIEGFKGLDVAGIKAAADEWKVKAEQAQADAEAKVSALKFDYALDSALTGAKARNPKTVKALLNMEGLKLTDEGVLGLKEQLETIKSANDFLFESDVPAPKVVAGSNNQSVVGDSFMQALRQGAGLPDLK